MTLTTSSCQKSKCRIHSNPGYVIMRDDKQSSNQSSLCSLIQSLCALSSANDSKHPIRSSRLMSRRQKYQRREERAPIRKIDDIYNICLAPHPVCHGNRLLPPPPASRGTSSPTSVPLLNHSTSPQRLSLPSHDRKSSCAAWTYRFKWQHDKQDQENHASECPGKRSTAGSHLLQSAKQQADLCFASSVPDCANFHFIIYRINPHMAAEKTASSSFLETPF